VNSGLSSLGAGKVTCIRDGASTECKFWLSFDDNLTIFSYLDLINLHLFHDDSNLLAIQNPSLYSANRKKAMEFVLQRYSSSCLTEEEKPALLFVFGDFNFRLNASSFLKVKFGSTFYNSALF
jgi:hypothetical protein